MLNLRSKFMIFGTTKERGDKIPEKRKRVWNWARLEFSPSRLGLLKDLKIQA